MNIEGKRILVTGGTGSLGQVLVRKLLSGTFGQPEKVIVFSRDEARQQAMRLSLLNTGVATDDIIFGNAARRMAFRIGDVRDTVALRAAVSGTDIVINAAAMKQVPTCEYFPEEAHQTNVNGTINLFQAIRESARPPATVVGISTDKAVKPVNVMGMTKALQERVLIRANLDCADTRFIAVRYGNVIASRGSVVPLFLDQIRRGGPITITDKRMTRFLMTLEDAVDTIAKAVDHARPGEIFIRRAPAARIVELARTLCDGKDIPLTFSQVRPGEKLHETLVSEEEVPRTVQQGGFYVVKPALPELADKENAAPAVLTQEYSSADEIVGPERLDELFRPGGTFHPCLEGVEEAV